MTFNLSDLRTRPIPELVEMARGLGVEGANSRKRQELIFEIVRRRSGAGTVANGAGVLETLPDGFGFLRSSDCNYLPGPDDIYVSPSQIRRFNLRTGDLVRGQVRAPKEGERYFALIKIEHINGAGPESERDRLLFDNLTATPPVRPLGLRGQGLFSDLIETLAPICFGDRVALVAEPGAGRTAAVRGLVQAIQAAQPQAFTYVVLIDERPEEVTRLQGLLEAEVVSSTFDEPAARHVQVAEMVLERARRQAERGRDVALFIDSMSRLARAYDACAVAGGRQARGLVDVGALQRSRKFFASGRALLEGGSITLIATFQAKTGSPVDEVVLDEFHSTANAEIYLSQGLARQALSPGLDPGRTFTRNLEQVDPVLADEVRVQRRALTGDGLADLEAVCRRIRSAVDPSPLDNSPPASKKGLSA